MNYLGLDYGEKHVGVAVAEGPLARPLTAIKTEKAPQLVRQLVYKHQIKAIIIGMHHASMHDALTRLGVPVYVVDETLSTHDATQFLFHTTQKRRKNLEHAAAAAIILQNWLDSRDRKR